MATSVPTPEQFCAAVRRLDYAALRALADRTRLSISTLNKIRSGITKDPRLSLVRVVWPRIHKAA